MSWSLTETRTLATKAARGGGMPWGLAEEAGAAVRWLQAHGAPGAAALAALLEASGSPNGISDPIALGAALLDANRCDKPELGLVRQPLLLAPFIAMIAPGGGASLSWQNVSVVIGPDLFATTASRDALLTAQADCRVGAVTSAPEKWTQQTRVPDEDGDAMKRLAVFAARTLAPATEASRLAGAGAGLSDND